MGGIKRVLGRKASLRLPARGSHSQNLTYCTKERTRVAEGLVWPSRDEWPADQQPGARTDLAVLMGRINDGATLADIRNEFPGPFLRYPGGIKQAMALAHRPDGWDRGAVRAWVVAGKAGIGKTRHALGIARELGLQPRDLYRWTPSAPWEQYQEESVVVLEDYNWKKASLDKLLEWVDRYHTQARVLYGTVWIKATRFILTSNYRFEDWWPEETEDRLAALHRRFVDWYWVETEQDCKDCYQAIKEEWNE